MFVFILVALVDDDFYVYGSRFGMFLLFCVWITYYSRFQMVLKMFDNYVIPNGY